MNKNYQPNLFGSDEVEEAIENVEVSVFCGTCRKGRFTKEKTPILTPTQLIEKGFVETAPGKWHKRLDACSRQCELELEKTRENE